MSDGRAPARSRNWCFTFNNPPVGVTFETFISCFGASFATGQLERGAEGTTHWQGFFQTRTPKALATIQGSTPTAWRPHYEVAHDVPASILYCRKADTRVAGPWTVGSEPQTQGRRNDLASVGHALFRGEITLRSIAAESPELFIRNEKGLRALSNMRPSPHRTNVAVLCIHGRTNLGKSTICHDLWPDLYSPNYGNCGVWFDSYDGQIVLMLDEFKGQIPLQTLLKICDPFPFTADAKHSAVAAAWTTVIFICNSDSSNWYSATLGKPDAAGAARTRDDELQALYSRLGQGDYPRHYSFYLDLNARPCADWAAARTIISEWVATCRSTLGADTYIPLPAGWPSPVGPIPPLAIPPSGPRDDCHEHGGLGGVDVHPSIVADSPPGSEHLSDSDDEPPLVRQK